ncbi:hypothetical protein RF11_07199 [Thelohanellus kitauei]|uniref:Integrase zinc-binding domain-containing protein n=1 Tax=Thelohanellus kitauei TaxID=669202 RepID=A0A0C2MCF4_THEKT|nr:hypothetical protein RF11_07199 [Thelohanellus kitauei]
MLFIESAHYDSMKNLSLLVIVPIIKKAFMEHFDDAIISGNGSYDKTLDRLRRMRYWPGMFSDTTAYCQACSHISLTTPTFLSNGPWETVGVDILELNNKSKLVPEDPRTQKTSQYWESGWKVFNELRTTVELFNQEKTNTIIVNKDRVKPYNDWIRIHQQGNETFEFAKLFKVDLSRRYPLRYRTPAITK